ncbi:MAG: hypothetical protein HY273_14425 [Gammaproteobacteria bacterium]|nr:hypothetical protein [Gammaproteobacteria bacterium]
MRKSQRMRLRSRNQKKIVKTSPAEKLWTEALVDSGKDRHEYLLKAADGLREEMEQQSLRVRDLILAQPPIQLLGYLVAQLHMGFADSSYEKEEASRSMQKELIHTYQFALEYVHAVWSCHAQLADEASPLDEQKAGDLFQGLEQLKNTTMMYCKASSARDTNPDRDRLSAEVAFHAKTSWVLIRGHRYQVLEGEFFRFILEPHRDALQASYGMDPHAIAAGIQSISDSMRVGFSEAVNVLQTGIEKTAAVTGELPNSPSAAIENLITSDPALASKMSNAINDIFYGGILNLSRHTNLSAPILDDLCYLPGNNTEFFADGEFKGTPMRTLPAMIKPGIKLGDHYYVTDYHFVRDAAYRAIQRGLLVRQPAYKEVWNRRQKNLVERAYPTIFNRQLTGATTYSEVYFKDPTTGQWVETDLVIVLEDVLFVIEAKAGVMAMHSPATNFDRHERAIRELILKAYMQCKRFVDYLAGAPEVALYKRINDEFVEAGLLKQKHFRIILPIGLTVEAFTPFSAMCKEFTEVQPLLGKHPFISMSVDDLFVINRFLPSTGELLHYLQIRQQVAGIPQAMLFDEIDHLGAYITSNRFDMAIRDQLKKADNVWLDAFCDIVDKYFEGDTWITARAPHQEFPDALVEILIALDRRRPARWLQVDSQIRDFGSTQRRNFAEILIDLKSTLNVHTMRRFLFGGASPMLVWLCRAGAEPSRNEMRHHGEVNCLAANVSMVTVLRLSFNSEGVISDVDCESIIRPTVIQSDYADLMREAERQGTRTQKLDLRTNSSRKRRQKK